MPLPGEWGAEGWEGPDRQLCLASKAGSPYAPLPRGGGTGQAAPSQSAEGRGGARVGPADAPGHSLRLPSWHRVKPRRSQEPGPHLGVARDKVISSGTHEGGSLAVPPFQKLGGVPAGIPSKR